MTRRLALLLSLCIPPAVLPCDSSTCSLVTRSQNGLLPKGVFRLDLSFRYTDDSVPLEGNTPVSEVFLPKVRLELGTIDPRIHEDIKSAQSYLQMDFGYGLTSGTTLLVSLPLLVEHEATVSHFGFTGTYKTTGAGDFVVGARQLLGAGIVGGFSVKTPTGPDDTTGDYDGSILDPTLQPGTGAWGFVTTLQSSLRIKTINWTLAATYEVNTTNSYGYRFGNLGSIALGGQRPLVGALSGSLQLKFVDEGRSLFERQGVPSTGSRVGYIAPGLSWRLTSEASVYGVVLLAPLRNMNEEQLGPHVSVVFGLSKSFRR
jgi:hypothetical protein